MIKLDFMRRVFVNVIKSGFWKSEAMRLIPLDFFFNFKFRTADKRSFVCFIQKREVN